MRRVIATSLVLASLAVGLFAGAASAAPRPISFEVFIGDSCVFGRAKDNSFLKVIIRDSRGVQKGREAVEADPDGFWQSCTFFFQPIRPGDTIKVTVFGTGQTRTLTVPVLTGKVDRGSNVVSGKAPLGSNVEIEAFDFRWDLWGEAYDEVRSVIATDGTFAYDFDDAGVNIRGGASVVVRWRNGSDTIQVGRFQYAPFISLALGGSEVVGSSGPNRHIRITLSEPVGTRVAVANGVGSYADTVFFSEFATTDGEPYRVNGGEWLNAPALGAQSSWRIPQINGSANLTTETVTGKCFDNGRYLTLVEDPNGFESGFTFGEAAGDGTFTADLADQVNIRRGFRVAILCYSPEGDEIVQEFIAS